MKTPLQLAEEQGRRIEGVERRYIRGAGAIFERLPDNKAQCVIADFRDERLLPGVMWYLNKHDDPTKAVYGEADLYDELVAALSGKEVYDLCAAGGTHASLCASLSGLIPTLQSALSNLRHDNCARHECAGCTVASMINNILSQLGAAS